MEKRAKAIDAKELETDIKRLNDEATSKGIIINDEKFSNGINNIPLYKP